MNLHASSEYVHDFQYVAALTSVTQRVATKPAAKAITDILENICRVIREREEGRKNIENIVRICQLCATWWATWLQTRWL